MKVNQKKRNKIPCNIMIAGSYTLAEANVLYYSGIVTTHKALSVPFF